jgi:hypothetical protein
MTEENKQQEKPKRWHIVLVTAIFLFLILLVIFYPFGSRVSIDEQLKAFDARRFVPDENNAATIYNKLIADFIENDFNSEITGVSIDNPKFRKPWRSANKPNAAEFLNNQKQTISTLLEALKKEKCYFPIETNYTYYATYSLTITNRLSKFRTWARLLSFAANNDIGEGRIEDAIVKYAGLMRMAEHLNQEKQTLAFLVSFAIEGISTQSIKTTVIESDITEKQLNLIEAIPLQTSDQWEKIYLEISKIDKLLQQKEFSKLPFPTRLTASLYVKLLSPSPSEKMHEIYLRNITDRRGIKILIALRHYKNKNGKWPEKLEQIKPYVEPEILIDPFNNGDFIYKLTDEGLTLYSIGKNKTDEGGNNTETADDWLIWPRK